MAQGRLLMLQARGGRLHLVAEKDVPGSVYTLCAFQVRPLCRLMCDFQTTNVAIAVILLQMNKRAHLMACNKIRG